MKHIIKLTKEDIIEILAKHFSTDIDKVDLECFMTTEGYGMMVEHIPSVKAEIEIPNG